MKYTETLLHFRSVYKDLVKSFLYLTFGIILTKLLHLKCQELFVTKIGFTVTIMRLVGHW